MTLGEHGDARRALIIAAGRRWWGAGLGGVLSVVDSQFVCRSIAGGAPSLTTHLVSELCGNVYDAEPPRCCAH